MNLPIKLYEVGDINHMVHGLVQTPDVIPEIPKKCFDRYEAPLFTGVSDSFVK